MSFEPRSNGRLVVALVVLAVLATLAWFTMQPGKPRALTLVLLGFFIVRTLLARMRSGARSRYDSETGNR